MDEQRGCLDHDAQRKAHVQKRITHKLPESQVNEAMMMLIEKMKRQ